jgi:hypothetical protein
MVNAMMHVKIGRRYANEDPAANSTVLIAGFMRLVYE